MQVAENQTASAVDSLQNSFSIIFSILFPCQTYILHNLGLCRTGLKNILILVVGYKMASMLIDGCELMRYVT